MTQPSTSQNDHDLLITLHTKLDILLRRFEGVPEKVADIDGKTTRLQKDFESYTEEHGKVHEAMKTDRRWAWDKTLAVLGFLSGVAGVLSRFF
jgi:hypothetical protein